MSPSNGDNPPQDLHHNLQDVQNHKCWDAVIVGAGPAGSVMAHQLACAGQRVLLVDKSEFPRSKPCGCCINSAALTALAHCGLGDLVRRCGGLPITSLDLRAAGAGSAAGAAGTWSTGVRLTLRPGAVLSRSAFDAALAVAAAEAGVTFLDGTVAVLGPRTNDAREIQLRRGAARITVKTRLVIAADGLAGTLLRDEPGFQLQISSRSRMGAAVTLPSGVDGHFSPGVIWMTCSRGGYVGAVQLETGGVHFAAALDPAFIRASGSPGAAAAEILRSAGRPVPESILTSRWHGTPALQRSRNVEGERLLVIGDAAGYVEPFTGEGMSWAITSAIAAAPIAAAAIQGRDIRGQWPSKHAALIASRQKLCRGIAWLLQHPRLAAHGVQLASHIPALSRPIVSAIGRPMHLAPMGAGAGA